MRPVESLGFAILAVSAKSRAPFREQLGGAGQGGTGALIGRAGSALG